MVKSENPETDKDVTESIDSCSSSPQRQINILEIENPNSCVTSTLGVEYPNLLTDAAASSAHSTLPTEEVSTTLCLYDKLWISNNKSLVESSARKHAASVLIKTILLMKKESEVEQIEREKTNLISEIMRKVSMTNGPHQEVSTSLSLFDQSWITNNSELAKASADIYSASVSRTKRKLSTQETEEKLKQNKVAATIGEMKHYSQKEEEEKGSTKLELYPDPFKIKKSLRASDLGNMCRLLLGAKLIENHVFPMWSEEDKAKVKSKDGKEVAVWDQNTRSEHKLVLKIWGEWKSYVLINKWRKDFVVRRRLNERDQIGIYWDQYYQRFTFSLLQRAAAAGT